MSTDLPLVASSPLPAGVLAILITMMSACSDDEPEQHVDDQVDKQPLGLVVQIPQQYSEPPPPGYGYVLQPIPRLPAPAPTDTEENPWAVQTDPAEYVQNGSRQWGNPQPRQSNYVQPQQLLPEKRARYRPLEPEQVVRAPRAAAPQLPVQTYRPVAPYDRLSGSSFGTPRYPYRGAYPGYYGSGVHAAPGGGYASPWWVGPGQGWPGHW